MKKSQKAIVVVLLIIIVILVIGFVYFYNRQNTQVPEQQNIVSSTPLTNPVSSTQNYKNVGLNFQVDLPEGSSFSSPIEIGSGGQRISFQSSSPNKLTYFRQIDIEKDTCDEGENIVINGIPFVKKTGTGYFGGMENETGSTDAFYCATNNGLRYTLMFTKMYKMISQSGTSISAPDTISTQKEFDKEVNLLNFKFINSSSNSISSKARSLLEGMKQELGVNYPITNYTKQITFPGVASGPGIPKTLNGYGFTFNSSATAFNNYLSTVVGPTPAWLASERSTGFINKDIVCIQIDGSSGNPYRQDRPSEIFCADLNQ